MSTYIVCTQTESRTELHAGSSFKKHEAIVKPLSEYSNVSSLFVLKLALTMDQKELLIPQLVSIMASTAHQILIVPC